MGANRLLKNAQIDRWIDRNYQIIFSGLFHVSVSKKGFAAVDIRICCLSTPVPAYLRFNAIEFEYDSFQKFERVKLHLHHLKNALIGAKFSITCCFDNIGSFKSSSIFLEQFVKEVLPIIRNDASESYGFFMDLDRKLDDCKLYVEGIIGIIAGIIIALPNSSDLSFHFGIQIQRWWYHGMKGICLPVNQISD